VSNFHLIHHTFSVKTLHCVHMYVNGKVSVETIPGMRGGRDEGEWRGIFKYDIFDIL
jgi:hypothetical protein